MAITNLVYPRLARATAIVASQAVDRDPSWYEFRVSPSCPPDTRLQVRGGTLWNPYPGDGYAWRLPSGVADVGGASNVYGTSYSVLHDETQPYTVAFAQAGYYRVYTLLLAVPYAEASGLRFRLSDVGADVEYATAVEAEQAWPDTASTDMEAWYNGYPLCGLVLRNDGRIGVAGAILPIDRVNRGRSYIWPPDCRPLDFVP